MNIETLSTASISSAPMAASKFACTQVVVLLPSMLPRLTLLGMRSILTAEWRLKLGDHLQAGLTYEALADLQRSHGLGSDEAVDLLARS
jgi:hypothetical protein